MPLDDLLETIETLQGRIQDHGPLLSQNEIRTRYALIDPLLRALGWDVANPLEVVPEQDASGGRADYALLKNGQPEVMVEAKRLGRSVGDGLDQAIAYCVGKGTPYFCVTDGDTWEVYETFRRVPTSEKVITQFKITRDKSAEVCLKALALWRPSVVDGIVSGGETPLLGAEETTAPQEETPPLTQWACPECEQGFAADDTRRIARHKQQHTLQRQQEATPPQQMEAAEAWISLAELEGRPFSKPRELLCPDGELAAAKSWTDLMTQLTQWLVDKGYLSEAKTPIQHGRRYLLAKEPVHPSGKPFINARQVGPLWLNSNYGASDHVRNAHRILERAEVSPTSFRVRLAE